MLAVGIVLAVIMVAWRPGGLFMEKSKHGTETFSCKKQFVTFTHLREKSENEVQGIATVRKRSIFLVHEKAGVAMHYIMVEDPPRRLGFHVSKDVSRKIRNCVE